MNSYITNALTKEAYPHREGSLKERDFLRVISIDGEKLYFENIKEYQAWCVKRQDEQEKEHKNAVSV